MSVDLTKCIICQEKSDGKVVSTSNGCKRIRDASDVRNDTVSKRLKLVEGDNFCYHVTNQCYKQYTMQSVLDRITKKSQEHDKRLSRAEHIRR